MARILIVRLGAMGDVLHGMIAAAALKRAAPGIELGWLVERRWAELLTSRDAAPQQTGPEQPIVDHLHMIDSFALRASPFSLHAWEQVRRLRRELRAMQYQATVDMQGSIKSALAATLAGAGLGIAGFADPRESAAKIFYRKRFPRRGEHVVEHIAALLGGALQADFPLPREASQNGPLLPRDAASEQWAEEELARRGIRRFAILNPGAGWAAKRWPIARYGEVAKALGKQGMAGLINHGPGEEHLAEALAKSSDGAASPVSCTLTQLVALARRASLFVGGDTGPMHLANALGVPVVAIFGPTSPGRNGPFFSGNARVLRAAGAETSYSHDLKSSAAIDSISAASVVEAARDLLQGGGIA